MFAPEVEYEQRGLVPDVVYTCSAVRRGDEAWMYCGAADTVDGLGTVKPSDLLAFVQKHGFLNQVGRGKGMAR